MEADKTAHGQRRFDILLAFLEVLTELEEVPTQDTATLKRVRQSGKHQVWRLAHSFDPQIALRLIVWFSPTEDQVVVALFSGDKKNIGDVFYDSVGSRADQAIDMWLREREAE